MSRLKRRRSDDFLLADEPTDLLITTADSEVPVEAHLMILVPCSKLVRDLPRASEGKTTWDLFQMVLEGQSSPVTQAVVQAWLDLVYSRVDARRQAPKFPSLSEAAHSLLLFADAVGTSTVALRAFVDALVAQPGLVLPVTVDGGAGAAGGGGAAPPPPLQLELALSGKLYYYTTTGPLCALSVPSSGGVVARVGGIHVRTGKMERTGSVGVTSHVRWHVGICVSPLLATTHR
jgi:hypothetical protein